jgi:hypothetical protein
MPAYKKPLLNPSETIEMSSLVQLKCYDDMNVCLKFCRIYKIKNHSSNDYKLVVYDAKARRWIDYNNNKWHIIYANKPFPSFEDFEKFRTNKLVLDRETRKIMKEGKEVEKRMLIAIDKIKTTGRLLKRKIESRNQMINLIGNDSIEEPKIQEIIEMPKLEKF